MSRSSPPSTSSSMRQAEEYARAQALTAGLSPAYLAAMLARQNEDRRLTRDEASASAAANRRRSLRRVRSTWPLWRQIADVVRPSAPSRPAGRAEPRPNRVST